MGEVTVKTEFNIGDIVTVEDDEYCGATLKIVEIEVTLPAQSVNYLCEALPPCVPNRVQHPEFMLKKIYWRTYSSSIKIPTDADSRIIQAIDEKIKRGLECVRHNLNYELFKKPYRRYRRSKNRCKWCGLKI